MRWLVLWFVWAVNHPCVCGTDYYVNDATRTDDVYCTAVGSDGNDGLTPATPMGGLQAVLDRHNLDPGDVVYVDTGRYVPSQGVTIATGDQGTAVAEVAIRGSTNSVGSTLDLGGGNGSVISCVAAYVVLEGLKLTGASNGAGVRLNANTASVHHVTVRSCELYGNLYGVELDWGPDQVKVEDCVIRDNTVAGVDVDSFGGYPAEQVEVAGSTLTGVDADGIRWGGTWDSGSLSMMNNRITVRGSGRLLNFAQKPTTLTADQNEFHVASGAWLGLYNGVEVTSLAAWQAATGQDGSSVFVDDTLAPKTYYVNDGLRTDDVYCTAAGSDGNDGLTPATPLASLQAMLDRYNLDAGDLVYVDTGQYVLTQEVTIGTGDQGTAAGVVTIRGSTNGVGSTLDLGGRSGSVIECRVAYVVLEGLRLTGASSGAGVELYDYNDGGHHVTVRGCELYGNSYGVRLDNGPDQATVEHCLIRDNTVAGVYFDTFASYAGEEVAVVHNTILGADSDGVKWAGPWDSGVLSMMNNRITVRGSGRLLNFAQKPTTLTADQNEFHVVSGAWLASFNGYEVMSLAAWQAATGQDGKSTFFDDTPPAKSYYVNDGSPADDVYCTAAGSAWNDGLTPATPLTSLQAVLDRYNLDPGDTVFVDTGQYVLTQGVTISAGDQGTAVGRVTIRGSTNAGGSTLDLAGRSGSVISCQAPYVVLEGLKLTGASRGAGAELRDNNQSGHHVTVRRCELFGNAYGVKLDDGPDQATVENCLIRDNTVAGVYFDTVLSSGAEQVAVVNNTILGADCDGVTWAGPWASGALSLRNNIISVRGSGVGVNLEQRPTTLTSDFNNLHNHRGAVAALLQGTNILSLQDWQRATVQDAHSLSVDPLFVNAAAGDYHLQSTAGSWHDGRWLADASDSTCIDAGDPAMGVGEEPPPHGGRANLGAHGRTAQASKSAAPNLPPTVAITQPAPNAELEGSVLITTHAADQDGNVVSVEFYGGPDRLSTVTNGVNQIFEWSWTDAPAGPHTLTARATDNRGASAVSAPVAITVRVAPQPTAFRFESDRHEAPESAGMLSLVVRKEGPAAGHVGYRTVPLTAEPGRDYVAAEGSIEFAVGDQAHPVVVRLLDDYVADGTRRFEVALLAPSQGATLGTPRTAVIELLDDDAGLSTNSLVELKVPGLRPAATGELQLELQPVEAQGQWRLPWELVWHGSGEVLRELEPGNYPVEFKPVARYREPDRATYPVPAGQLVRRTLTYTAQADRPSGSLRVDLQPLDLLGETGLMPGWRLRGETAYRDSGVASGPLPVGVQIVEFKPLTGWTTPIAREVAVVANLESVATAAYLLAPPLPSGVALPVPLRNYAAIRNALAATPRRPLALNGQLRSAAGWGSGIAVREKVVLTAAHVLLDEVTLDYVTALDWIHERHAGDYEPRPLAARGWYVFEEYLTQRRLERAAGHPPGEATAASQQWDVAAVYFAEAAARGGYSGYLLSEADENEWLLDTHERFLSGYPLTGTADGRLHEVPSDFYRFVGHNGRLFTSGDFLSYPGNSGGPLCVHHAPSGACYPAAVYLGSVGGRSIVRAIDRQVVELINRAASSADLGTNFAGGGVINFSTQGGLQAFALQTLTVTLEPGGAVSAGAAWRVSEFPKMPYTNVVEASVELVAGVAYVLVFTNVPGFQTPADFPVTLPAGQDARLTVAYEPIEPPRLWGTVSEGLFVSGPAGVTLVIEYRRTLSAEEGWSVVRTLTLGNQPEPITGPPWTGTATGFYRARRDP